MSIVAGVPRKRDETLDEWQRRRSRNSGAIARKQGSWSERHLDRPLAWRAHLERAATYDTIPATIWFWRDALWRQDQRNRVGSRSLLAGRLGTRVVTHVYQRWEDSLL